jgi:hypothetical protein
MRTTQIHMYNILLSTFSSLRNNTYSILLVIQLEGTLD